MTTQHPAMDWFAGDDWEINATLLDENGAPFDLSQTHEIKWVLVDSNKFVVISDAAAVVTIVDPPTAGKCTILIPAAVTATLMGGHYSDAIRLIMGGITSTLVRGMIYVTGDPWQNSAARRAALRSVS